MSVRLFAAILGLVGLSLPAVGQNYLNTNDDSRTNRSIFRPLDDWPDPNDYRNAAGSPGPKYWQQRADYVIHTQLDTVEHIVSGSERITYHNNSPDVLRYVWVQLDQNIRSQEHSRRARASRALPEEISPWARRWLGVDPFDGGYKLARVQVDDASGKPVDARYRVRDTIMKVWLAEPLEPGASTGIEIEWSFRVPDGGRGAKERIADGWMYELAQWFPRMSVYDDVNGWQTDQFLGSGEFYLNFGDYDVSITVPWNHIVNATGVLQNPEEVLTTTQRERLEESLQSREPEFIIAADEVLTPETRPVHSGTLTWRFKADNVRDFAWVSSPTYVWDAAGFKYEGQEDPIAVYSFYPRVAMPLWDKVSTRATIQTLETYGRMAFPYPYPKVTNVHGPVWGMEYPMLAMCGARPGPDGSYSYGLERALISVTIHEVGHNWFPMIVASDERKWTWMDEGLNTFLQHYGELDYVKTWTGTDIWKQTSDGTYQTPQNPTERIVDYMLDSAQVPIMTQSDLIQANFGNNGYSKPQAGLVMLREHILDPQIFDEAFGEYSQKWMFKHPQPADFFRSIEEGSGEYLPWFWRGWFYTTHYNDQAVDGVTAQMSDSLLGDSKQGRYYYRIGIKNEGGIVMPVHLAAGFDDGSTEYFEVPADAWRSNELEFKKGFFSDKRLVRVELDPDRRYSDVNRDNNVWERGNVELPILSEEEPPTHNTATGEE